MLMVANWMGDRFFSKRIVREKILVKSTELRRFDIKLNDITKAIFRPVWESREEIVKSMNRDYFGLSCVLFMRSFFIQDTV